MVQLAQFAVAGGLVVAIAAFGLLVFDANAAVIVTSRWEYAYTLYYPSAYSVLYGCIVAIILFGSLTLLTALGGIVLSILGIGPKIAKLGLFGAAAVLFIGLLVATAVAVDTGKYGSSASSLYMQDAHNYNGSDEIRKYVDEVRSYTAPPPSFSLGPIAAAPENPPTPIPEWVCADQVLKSFAANFNIQYWNPFDFLSAVKGYITSEGCFPNVFLSSLLFVYYYSQVPLANEYTWSSPPRPSQLFSPSYTGTCYGLSAVAESVDTVAKSNNLCDLKLEAKGCAPGWDTDRMMSFACGWFENCVETTQEERDKAEENEKTVWPELGAKKGEASWQFPAGWNQLDDLKSYWRDEESEALNLAMAGFGEQGGMVFAQTNLVFLVIGVIGWVFLILGIVVGFIGGGDDDGADP
jgi:hypothetical protein